MQSLRFHSLRGRLAQPAWIDNVTFENLSQHLARALVHFRHARMIINILIQKFPQRAVRFEQFVAVANERRRLFAHIIGALHANIDNRFCARSDHILHLHVDDVADDQFVQFGLTRIRIARQDRAMAALPHRVFLQLPGIENFKIDCVVKIVRPGGTKPP